MPVLKESELVINPDGSIYHLKVRPHDIAPQVILVGDPKRVDLIATHLDHIENRVSNREFVTVTGQYHQKRVTIMATGIGTDNIDIVMNELDALVNIDFSTRQVKPDHTRLHILRLGTTGAVQADIPVNSYIASRTGLGMDGLVHFYNTPPGLLDQPLAEAFREWTGWDARLPDPYAVEASSGFFEAMTSGMHEGITLTAPGFYGPQGRVIRLPLAHPGISDRILSFRFEGKRIVNFEMETSALYALGRMLGHEVLTVCLAIANRATGDFNAHYENHVSDLSILLLDRLTGSID